ncbi:hypothetical protein FRB98_003410 [Tulasnella sp. 332]|nr:hypothetical protein FRB98_003410 [Tulasnella sp. 332]
MRNLRRIKLHFFYSEHSINTDMTDADFAALCEALPRLEEFDISHRVYNGENMDMTPKATLQTLLSLSRHCTGLQRLAISINASADVPAEESGKPHQSRRLEQLKSLDFANSRLSSTKINDVVKFLREVLPPGYQCVLSAAGLRGTELQEGSTSIWDESLSGQLDYWFTLFETLQPGYGDSDLGEVVVSLGKLRSRNLLKRVIGHGDDPLKITAFKEKIKDATSAILLEITLETEVLVEDIHTVVGNTQGVVQEKSPVVEATRVGVAGIERMGTNLLPQITHSTLLGSQKLIERLGTGDGGSADTGRDSEERASLEGTRKAVLAKIEQWMDDPAYHKQHILWLKAPERKKLTVLETARQLASQPDGSLRASVAAAVKAEPNIAHSTTAYQCWTLIHEPLLTLNAKSTLAIVFNGSDECEDNYASKLVDLIGRDHHHLPSRRPLLFGLGSRTPHYHRPINTRSTEELARDTRCRSNSDQQHDPASFLPSEQGPIQANVKKIPTTVLSWLGSVVTFPDGDDTATSGWTQFLHQSFVDFPITKHPCHDHLLLIIPGQQEQMVTECLQRMCGLKQNICHLSDPSLLNSEGDDMTERIRNYISPALQYACLYWGNHLSETMILKKERAELYSLLEEFVKHKMLNWVEVMGLLGKIKEAASLVRSVEIWVTVCWYTTSSYDYADEG